MNWDGDRIRATLPRDNLYLINRAKGRPWAPAGPRWHSCWPTPPRHPYEHIEDVDGAVMFRQACVMGLEGVVAKRRDRPYRSRCLDWIKEPSASGDRTCEADRFRQAERGTAPVALADTYRLV